MVEKKNKKCSLAEKDKLAKLCIKYKEEYDRGVWGGEWFGKW